VRAPRWTRRGLALLIFLQLAAAGCDGAPGGSSPFRNLGKRGDGALPASAPRSAPR
jgi:hypothetical protein